MGKTTLCLQDVAISATAIRSVVDSERLHRRCRLNNLLLSLIETSHRDLQWISCFELSARRHIDIGVTTSAITVVVDFVGERLSQILIIVVSRLKNVAVGVADNLCLHDLFFII